MMDHKNLVHIIGDVSKIMYRSFDNGGSVASINIAVNYNGKDQHGKAKVFKSWVDAEAWNDMANEINNTFKDGDLIEIQGFLRKTSYEKDGKKIYKTFVSVQQYGKPNQSFDTDTNFSNDDIPF